MQTHPLEFTDFSGGQTDYFIDAPKNRFEEGDNFLIFKYGQIGRLFTRPGSVIWDANNPQIPAGNQRIGALKYFQSTLLVQSARKLNYINAGTFTTLQGPTSNDLFPPSVTVANHATITEAQDQLLIGSNAYTKVHKVYKDSGGVFQLRTAGMPALASTPSGSPTAGANNYLYRFHYQYTYTVGTVTHIDLGPTTELEVLNADQPQTNQIAITNIPVIANGTDYNYDTASANLIVRISRTVNNGQTFYYIGSVQNGTTTFNDNFADTVIVDNEPLYTEGGVVEPEEPPLCKTVHAVNDRCYYGNVKVGSQIFANRVYQSIPGDLDGVPGDYFSEEARFPVVGISSHRSIVIAATERGVYRVEGQFDAAGNGGIVLRSISETASCVSESSLVQTPVGVFWAGVDGFYWSDAYQSFRVSKMWDNSYAELVNDPTKWGKIQGRYDRRKNRVYFTCSDDASGNENNLMYVLDLNFGGPADDMPFTSWSGNSFAPTAIEFIDQELIRGDKRGYILVHRDAVEEDPKIDTSLAPANWTTEAIIYSYKGPATNFGSSFARKFVPWMSIVAQSDANLTLQIVSNNDRDRVIGNLKPIVARPNLVWGDRDIIWGDIRIVWGGTGLIQQKRRFPRGGLRCNYKQIQLTNAFVEIYNSDGYGLADVNATLKTATLTDDEWPVNPLDYYISFADDGFEREYLVTARTPTVLTYADPSNFSLDGTGGKWVIRGYPRGEILFLIGYVINYAMFGKTFEPFRSGSLVSLDD